MLTRVRVDQVGQRNAETFFVGSTFVSVNRVRVRVNRFCVTRRPLHGHFERNGFVSVFSLERNDVFVNGLGLLRRIQVLHVIKESVVILERDFTWLELFFLFFKLNVVVVDLFCAFVAQSNTKSLVQERHLLEASAQRFKVELDGVKNLLVRPERNDGSGVICDFTLCDLTRRHTTLITLAPHVAVTVDFCVHLFRQRVYHGRTYTVQTTGHCVSTATELTSGVQDRQNHLQGGDLLSGVHGNRDTTTSVFYPHSPISQNGDVNRVVKPGQSFINRVIDDFINQVVQTSFGC